MLRPDGGGGGGGGSMRGDACGAPAGGLRASEEA